MAHTMSDPVERDLGPQPLGDLLDQLGLSASDLVAASEEGLTFKQVARAAKGRRLTANAMGKVERALAEAAGRSFARPELFTYEPLP